MDDNVAEAAVFNFGQNLYDPVFERFAAQQVDARIILCLPNEMLATAEANLKY